MPIFRIARSRLLTAVPMMTFTIPMESKSPASPFQLMAGSLISASLVTGINSDLPGTVIAQVTQPVYDSISGTHLLIPQGSRLIGRYQSEISFGQSRALLVWDRILFPDGRSIRISEPGADTAGAAGLSDRTDNHWNKVLAAAGLATILGMGAEFGKDDDGLERAIRRGFGDSISDAGQRVVDRNLAIQPTLRIRPGWPVRILVTRDIIFEPFERP
jgi:type IV secretory pathway VirB10-like protein